jgi:hypothetical protein
MQKNILTPLPAYHNIFAQDKVVLAGLGSKEGTHRLCTNFLG